MATRRPAPYIWTTWLAKAMSGDNPCLWQSWFQAHYTHVKLPDEGDFTQWKCDHTRMLIGLDQDLAGVPGEVRREWPISAVIGPHLAVVSGKIDRLVIAPPHVVVYDCKTGKPRAADVMQVLIYLHLLAQHEEFRGLVPVGVVRYREREEIIDGVPESFVSNFAFFVELLSGSLPPGKAPGQSCRFCTIGQGDCPERVEPTPKPSQVPLPLAIPSRPTWIRAS